MIFPDAKVEGEFRPVTIGQVIASRVWPDIVKARRLELERALAVAKAQRACADRRVAVATSKFTKSIDKLTESPIETQMGVALYEIFANEIFANECEIIPGWKWERYRADWIVRKPNGKIAVVECDGAPYHSSKDQIAKDRRRDRKMLRAGLAVFRFTGSDIFLYADICALKVKVAFWEA